MWLIKDQVLRVHATSIRRFGMGVPYAENKPGATPQEIAETQRMVANLKATEHLGASLPHGVTLKLAGLTGSVPDAVAFLDYLDRQMTRATLTSLLDMATATRGSRSLGETIMDVMVYAQQAVADNHADTATRQIVVPLVDANWSEDEPAPRVVCEDVGADLELTAEDIFNLMRAGALIGDPQLWAWMRDRYRLPDIDEYLPEYVPKPNTDTTTSDLEWRADACREVPRLRQLAVSVATPGARIKHTPTGRTRSSRRRRRVRDRPEAEGAPPWLTTRPRYRFRGSSSRPPRSSGRSRRTRNADRAEPNGSKSTSATIDIFDVIDSWGGWWGISAAEVDAGADRRRQGRHAVRAGQLPRR
jgi:hypothetical protein